jgi:hypothetical protein
MKNNRLTNKELREVREYANEIARIASMKTCAFKDKEMVEVKNVRYWTQWFECYADKILKIVGGKEEIED